MPAVDWKRFYRTRYVDAIYRSHDTIGPYYVVALVLRCLMRARKRELTSCHYTDPDPFRCEFWCRWKRSSEILIVLAATDSTSHIEAISQLPSYSITKKTYRPFWWPKRRRHFVCYCALLIQRNIYENYSVCGNGLGTSLMMEMSIKSILRICPSALMLITSTWAPRKGREWYLCRHQRHCRAVSRAVCPGKIVALENMIDKKAMRERLPWY